MFKGLMNLFKCCKSHNRANKEQLESLGDYRVRDQKEAFNNNGQKTPSINSLDPNTNKSIKDNTPDGNSLREVDLNNCSSHYKSNSINLKNNTKDQADQNQYCNIYINKIDDKNYASNEILIEEVKITDINKLESKIIIENNFKSLQENEKMDYDKIIVPDHYIREEEKSIITWVNSIMFFCFFIIIIKILLKD